MDKKMSDLGRHGAEIRWSNYRKHLIDELSKLCDKKELNYYMAFSNSALQEALLIKRKQKDEKRNDTT